MSENKDWLMDDKESQMIDELFRELGKNYTANAKETMSAVNPLLRCRRRVVSVSICGN